MSADVRPALVRRWLKTADATAITAHRALQRDLGYGKKVARVYRSEVFSLEWEDDQPAAQERVRALVLDTNLMLNPNKHFMELVFGAEPLTPRGNAWVLVAEPDAGGRLLHTINKRHLLPFRLAQVHRGTLWELDLAGDDPQALAGDMAVTRSRKQGLLGNPHIEGIHVLSSPPTATALAGLMHHNPARA